MTKILPDQPYVAHCNGRPRTSRFDGNVYYEVDLVGLDDQKLYHTYAVKAHNNFGRWKPIVDDPIDQLHLVSGQMVLKKNKDDLIDADSDFNYLGSCNDHQFIDLHRKLKGQ